MPGPRRRRDKARAVLVRRSLRAARRAANRCGACRAARRAGGGAGDTGCVRARASGSCDSTRCDRRHGRPRRATGHHCCSGCRHCTIAARGVRRLRSPRACIVVTVAQWRQCRGGAAAALAVKRCSVVTDALGVEHLLVHVALAVRSREQFSRVERLSDLIATRARIR